MRIPAGTGKACAWFLAAALCALALGPCLAQVGAGDPRRTSIYVPDPTNEGSWDGTWMYQSVAMKMALWMRTRKGVTEFKLRYESLQRGNAFETDWNGDASYYASEYPATFQMHRTQGDANRIEGTWFWESQSGSTLRVEKGKFRLFRALDGRTMVFRFEDFELSTSRRGQPYRSAIPPVWTFVKVSKRLALWDELPF